MSEVINTLTRTNWFFKEISITLYFVLLIAVLIMHNYSNASKCTAEKVPLSICLRKQGKLRESCCD